MMHDASHEKGVFGEEAWDRKEGSGGKAPKDEEGRRGPSGGKVLRLGFTVKQTELPTSL